MSTEPGRPYVGYVTVLTLGTVTHLVLPAWLRPGWFLLIAASVLPPSFWLLRRTPKGSATGWWLLSGALVLLALGNGVRVFVTGHQSVAELLVTIGHAGLLAAALALVVQRGRGDLGGLIDAAVVAMGFGSLLWTCVLQPKIVSLGTPIGAQVPLLITVYVLTGVLGALGRLWATGHGYLLALRLLVYALVFALIGNSFLMSTAGVMTYNREPWIEALFLLSYACVGGAVAHGSAIELAEPARTAPADRLSATRLVFLGAAVAVGPALGGGRELLGLAADGLLIAMSTITVVPLVMLRIGGLSVQRERAELALAHQATHDVLTGLPNRAAAMARLSSALDRERAGADFGAARGGVVLLFVDLNGFKGINDRLGHAAGDLLLVQIGARLAAGLRSGDTVARYGGDEFLVLCEHTTRGDAVDRLCRHLDAALAEPFDLGGELVSIGASVGAVASDGMCTAEELIRRADLAMYEAKQRRDRAAAVSVTVG